MNGVILHKGNQFYTFLYPIFEAIRDEQVNYNWLVTECDEWGDIFRKYDCICYDKYIWISGKELTKLIRENVNSQMIWGVLSGFDTKYTLEEILQYPKPYADMNYKLWENPITIQNPLAKIEIVAFDSSYTLIKCMDKKLLEDVKQTFPFCEDLELYNNRGFDEFEFCGYEGNYWVIDGKPLPEYLDAWTAESKDEYLKSIGYLIERNIIKW